MTAELLLVEGLRKAFKGQVILDGLDLRLSQGSITTVLGKSGVGKSVFLKCLAGLIEPDAGRVLLGGQEVYPHPTETDWRRHMGYLFQGNALFEHLTLEQNVLLPLTETTGKGMKTFRQRGSELLEALDLGDAAQKRPSELSGGMRRRAALARCLIQNPGLVLFDEPTTGLDPMRSEAVFEMVARYRDELGFSALIVSHDIPASLKVSDAAYVLKAGRLHEIADLRTVDPREVL